MTTEFPRRQVHALHPVRPPKPAPGSRIYSRYIPALGEFFSVYALDYTNEQHLQLFHTWQNDPRVAEQWKETGTLDEHREYLRQIHEDPHQMAVLAKFNDIFFSYHEIYWAKVSLPFHPHYSKLTFSSHRKTISVRTTTPVIGTADGTLSSAILGSGVPNG